MGRYLAMMGAALGLGAIASASLMDQSAPQDIVTKGPIPLATLIEPYKGKETASCGNGFLHFKYLNRDQLFHGRSILRVGNLGVAGSNTTISFDQYIPLDGNMGNLGDAPEDRLFSTPASLKSPWMAAFKEPYRATIAKLEDHLRKGECTEPSEDTTYAVKADIPDKPSSPHLFSTDAQGLLSFAGTSSARYSFDWEVGQDLFLSRRGTIYQFADGPKLGKGPFDGKMDFARVGGVTAEKNAAHDKYWENFSNSKALLLGHYQGLVENTLFRLQPRKIYQGDIEASYKITFHEKPGKTTLEVKVGKATITLEDNSLGLTEAKEGNDPINGSALSVSDGDVKIRIIDPFGSPTAPSFFQGPTQRSDLISLIHANFQSVVLQGASPSRGSGQSVSVFGDPITLEGKGFIGPYFNFEQQVRLLGRKF